MIICKVTGHVWATRKEETLRGFKLMVVQEIGNGKKSGNVFVAADSIGAGVGENVLVVSGSTARKAFGSDDLPVDCAIVGIIDSLEVAREAAQKEEK